MNVPCAGCLGAPCAAARTLPCPKPMDAYDPNFAPAPILQISARVALCEARTTLRAFLDTGADLSWIGRQGAIKLTMETGWTVDQLAAKIRSGGKAYPVIPNLHLSFNSGRDWLALQHPVHYTPTGQLFRKGNLDMLIGRDILRQFQFCCHGAATFMLRALTSQE